MTFETVAMGPVIIENKHSNSIRQFRNFNSTSYTYIFLVFSSVRCLFISRMGTSESRFMPTFKLFASFFLTNIIHKYSIHLIIESREKWFNWMYFLLSLSILFFFFASPVSFDFFSCIIFKKIPLCVACSVERNLGCLSFFIKLILPLSTIFQSHTICFHSQWIFYFFFNRLLISSFIFLIILSLYFSLGILFIHLVWSGVCVQYIIYAHKR